MKFLILMLVVPAVLAGGADFAKMWAKMEKEMQEKGEAGEKDSGEKQMDWDDMQKAWQEQQKGSGWGEQPQQPQQPGCSGGCPMQSQDQKSNYDMFKAWMKMQEERKEENEEKEEEMKKNMEMFKEYMKEKAMKEQQEKESDMVLYKEMQKLKMKKEMTQKLYNMSRDYMAQKMKFKYDITNHFLSFCNCDTSASILERIHNGQFGGMEYAGMGGNMDGGMGGGMNPSMSEGINIGMSLGQNMGQPMSTNSSGSGMSGNNTMPGNSTRSPAEMQKMRENVEWFSKLSRAQQVQHVLSDLIKVMCEGGKQYVAHLKEVESLLIEYKRKDNSW